METSGNDREMFLLLVMDKIGGCCLGGWFTYLSQRGTCETDDNSLIYETYEATMKLRDYEAII